MKIRTLNWIRAGALVAARILAVAFVVSFAIAVLSMSSCQREPGHPPGTYRCDFQHSTGTYFVTGRELDKDGSLVIVTKGDRTLALRRDGILACELEVAK